MNRPSILAAALLLTVPALPPGATALHAQETHLLVVSGLGGEPQYQQEFVEWGLEMMDAALAAGVPEENLVFLAEDPSAAPGRIRARSTREEVERAIDEIAATATPDDRVLIVLIGHGSGSGEDSRVSIPGPSLRASEYAELIERLAPREVAVVNVASASGDFVPVLAGENHIVVTATRSSQQRNAAIFGGYFVEAYQDASGDTDRDGRVSILEAFEYARQQTERYYSDRGLIKSETALIEDRPDGDGSETPMSELGVGLLASRFFLESAVPTDLGGDSETAARLRELYEAQDRMDGEVARLRQQQDSLDPDAYRATLDSLLLELARTGSEIRELEGSN
jgi:hypothetical protein